MIRQIKTNNTTPRKIIIHNELQLSLMFKNFFNNPFVVVIRSFALLISLSRLSNIISCNLVSSLIDFPI